MSDERTPTAALALPVQSPVRPCAWTLQAELDARGTTCRAHLWFSDPVNSAWAPLYDQAAVDAAVERANARQNAAWRLMCEKMVAAERERWRAAVEGAAYYLEKARVWNGAEWHYNALHPMFYKPAIDRLREVLGKKP